MDDYALLADEEARQKQNSSAAPADDTYATMAAQEVESRKSALTASLRLAVPVNPDQQAKVVNLSSATGIPADVVSRNEAAIAEQARVRELLTLAQDSPILAAQLTDPDFAKLAHADAENLGTVEQKITRNLVSFSKWLSQDLPNVPGKNLAAVGASVHEMSGGLWGYAAEMPADLASKYITRPIFGQYDPIGPIAQFARKNRKLEEATAKSIDQYWGLNEKDAYVANMYYGALKSVWQSMSTAGIGALMQIGTKAAAPAVLTGNLVSRALQAGQEMPLGALLPMMASQGGQTYGKDIDQGVSPLVAAGHATSDAMIEGLTEQIGLGRFVHDIKVGDPIWKVIRNQLLTENVGEQVATLTENLNAWAVTPENKDKTFGDFLAEVPAAALDTFVQTTMATVMQTGIMGLATTHMHRDIQAENAARHGIALQELLEIAAKDPTRTRSPVDFAAFVQNVANQGDTPTVWIDGATFAQAAQDKIDIAALMPETAKQLAEAIQNKTDVEIPLGEFTAAIPGTGLEQTLLQDVRTTIDGPTMREAADQKWVEDTKAAVEKIINQQEFDTALKQSAATVEGELLTQLNTANRFTKDVNTAYAKLASAFYQVQGARLGVTPEEMYVRYPLRIAAEGLGGSRTMEQANAGAVSLDSLAREGNDQAVVAQALVNRASAGAEQRADVLVSESLTAQSDRLGGIPSLTPVLAQMRSAILDNAQVLNAVVASVPVAMVNDLFGSEASAKVALHDQAMLKDSAAFNADLPVSSALGDAADPVSLLVREAAFKAAELVRSTRSARGEALESGAALLANERDSFSQGKSPRAQITFGKDITKDPTIISLLSGADLSSFLHELGHFQLEVIADIAGQADAPAEIVADMDALLKWFGVADLATWQAMTLEEKRPYHEQFARGFEAYLFEGKSPSIEMNGIFGRFRAWLINVYKNLAALNVEVTDEVRQVFDRMIATTQEIQNAEAARGYVALFESATIAGATPEQWKAYQELGIRATQDAVDQLQARSLADMKWLEGAKDRALRRLQQDAKEKRTEVGKEVADEVNALPIYQAIRFLKYGEVPQSMLFGQGIPLQGKLDLGALKEMYGDGPAAPWRYLTIGEKGVAAAEGVHPDALAMVLGFKSGDDLVRQILAAPPVQDVIREQTDQRMLERYGDLSTPAAIDQAANEAIHNQARARFIATELRFLSNALNARGTTSAGGSINILAAAAKQFAYDIISRKKVRDIKPSVYEAAEAKAAKAAEAAIKPKAKTKTQEGRAEGDMVLAATEKRNQLVNHYAAGAAYDALDYVAKGLRYLKKLEGNKAIDIGYRDQIDQLLERFDLRKLSNKTIDQRKSLAEWITAQEEAGMDPVISDQLRNEAFRISYKEMTVEELKGLIDAVKNIEHLGRLKNKLLTARDKRDLAAARAEIVAEIEKNAKGKVPDRRSSDRGFLVKPAALFRQFLAIHRKFASMASMFDGYKAGGVAWSYLVRNMNDAGAFEAVHNEQATIALSNMLNPVFKEGKLSEKIYIKGITKPFTREERIGILLNLGNETNSERVLIGEKFTQDQLQELLAGVTPVEAKFANDVWAYLDSFRPLIAEKERRITGVEPEWVKPVPFELTLKDGTKVKMTGGYYPIAYDQLRSERSGADAASQVAKQMLAGFYSRSQTARGHTKARVESTGRPLRYDFGDVITQHIQQVVHDLAWHEYLIDANRLLRPDTEVDQAIRDHYGVEVLKEMKDTLRDIAVGGMAAEKGAFAWNHLRYGTTIVGLGFNIFNTIQNLTGITQSMSHIGTKWVLKGAAHWAGDAVRFESAIKEMHEKSDTMRLRAKTMLREINDIRNKVSGNDSKLQAAYFLFQNKTQLVVDTPTWWGAYEKAMSEPDMTEDKAIAMADSAVIDSQGGGQIKDLSGIQRGGAGMKLFTTFYSFFNTTFNLMAQAKGRTDFHKPGEVALFVSDIALLWTIPALLTTLLKAAFTGDWDKDSFLKKMLGDQISFLMGTMVGMREAAAGVQAATGTGQGFGYTGPASVRFFSDLYQLGTQINQGEADEPFWKSLNNVGGVLFHYPAGQINRTLAGINALSDGRTTNPLAVLMGPPAKQ